jgi:hypothetical protein
MPSNMMQFMSMVKSNSNPQAFVMNMLSQQAGQNPAAQNLLSMVQKGDTQGVETFVRNVAKEKGIDFDKEFANFRQMFGI